MPAETLREFIRDYEGFDWKDGEVTIFNQRKGEYFIGKINAYEFEKFCKKYGELTVYNWDHTARTMIIVL